MKRLTPEREQGIRSWLSLEGNIRGDMTYELLDEIDVLRGELGGEKLGFEFLTNENVCLARERSELARRLKRLRESLKLNCGFSDGFIDELEAPLEENKK